MSGPYIVLTTTDGELVARHAYATLDGARSAALKTVHDTCLERGSTDGYRQFFEALHALRGGFRRAVVGTTPDGTRIEFELTTWERLADDAGMSVDGARGGRRSRSDLILAAWERRYAIG